MGAGFISSQSLTAISIVPSALFDMKLFVLNWQFFSVYHSLGRGEGGRGKGEGVFL